MLQARLQEAAHLDWAAYLKSVAYGINVELEPGSQRPVEIKRLGEIMGLGLGSEAGRTVRCAGSWQCGQPASLRALGFLG